MKRRFYIFLLSTASVSMCGTKSLSPEEDLQYHLDRAYSIAVRNDISIRVEYVDSTGRIVQYATGDEVGK